MDVRELRIGNLVQVSDKITPVHHITLTEGGYLNHKSPELFSGIPITEEWLLKAGFEKEECDAEALSVWYEYYKGDFEVFTTGTEGGCENEFCYKVNTHRVHYIHQLQNLYFALTGQELTFNLY